jgi:hypothetical protein
VSDDGFAEVDLVFHSSAVAPHTDLLDRVDSLELSQRAHDRLVVGFPSPANLDRCLSLRFAVRHESAERETQLRAAKERPASRLLWCP